MPDIHEPTFLPKEPLEIPAHLNSSYDSGIKTLLSWTAPGRPFRKRSKEYFVSSVLLIILFEIVAFLFSQYYLMATILGLGFLAFALAIVPPQNFHYRISTEGVMVEDHFFLWGELYDFYFKKRDGIIILHIRTQAFYPSGLVLTLGSMDQEHVKSILVLFIPYREFVKPTFMEKSGDWLANNFPLEKQPASTSS